MDRNAKKRGGKGMKNEKQIWTRRNSLWKKVVAAAVDPQPLLEVEEDIPVERTRDALRADDTSQDAVLVGLLNAKPEKDRRDILQDAIRAEYPAERPEYYGGTLGDGILETRVVVNIIYSEMQTADVIASLRLAVRTAAVLRTEDPTQDERLIRLLRTEEQGDREKILKDAAFQDSEEEVMVEIIGQAVITAATADEAEVGTIEALRAAIRGVPGQISARAQEVLRADDATRDARLIRLLVAVGRCREAEDILIEAIRAEYPGLNLVQEDSPIELAIQSVVYPPYSDEDPAEVDLNVVAAIATLRLAVRTAAVLRAENADGDESLIRLLSTVESSWDRAEILIEAIRAEYPGLNLADRGQISDAINAATADGAEVATIATLRLAVRTAAVAVRIAAVFGEDDSNQDADLIGLLSTVEGQEARAAILRDAIRDKYRGC